MEITPLTLRTNGKDGKLLLRSSPSDGTAKCLSYLKITFPESVPTFFQIQ